VRLLDFCSARGAAQPSCTPCAAKTTACRLLRVLDDAESALDLEVHTKPIEFAGQQFVPSPPST
jgi:hypothetical protein